MASTNALRSLSVSTFDGSWWIKHDWAIAALTRTNTVPVPAKLMLGRRQFLTSVRIETIDSQATPNIKGLHDAEKRYLKGIIPWNGPCAPVLAPRPKAPPAKPLCFPEALANGVADALEAAEWTVPPRAKDSDPATTPLRAAPPWAAMSFVTIAPAAPGFVRVALGVDVLRAEHGRARTAVGLFALQASARLVLARPTLGSATARDKHDSGKLTIGWDAVVAAIDSQPIERAVETIAHAAAACDVARRLTLESFRALAQSAELADAYFASDSRFENFRSIGAGKAPAVTTAQTDTEENDACRPQPQL